MQAYNSMEETLESGEVLFVLHSKTIGRSLINGR